MSVYTGVLHKMMYVTRVKFALVHIQQVFTWFPASGQSNYGPSSLCVQVCLHACMCMCILACHVEMQWFYRHAETAPCTWIPNSVLNGGIQIVPIYFSPMKHIHNVLLLWRIHNGGAFESMDLTAQTYCSCVHWWFIHVYFTHILQVCYLLPKRETRDAWCLPLSGISWLSFDSTLLSPFLFFC